MIEPIERFTGRNVSAVRKLNQIRTAVNQLLPAASNGIIITNVTGAGSAQYLSIDQLIARVRGQGGNGSLIYTAYCKTDAPAATTITCYLDYDGTQTLGAFVVNHEYKINDIITGDDDGRYKSKLDFTASADGAVDMPVTGTDWETYWSKIVEIDVLCDISGGGVLRDAVPHLLTLQQTGAYVAGTVPQFVWKIWRKAELFEEDDIVAGDDNYLYRRTSDNPTEIETDDTKPTTGEDYATHWELATFVEDDVIDVGGKEYFICLDANTGNILNWPYGDDGEDYWECMLRKADELQVINSGGVYKALGRFQASFERIA